MPSNIICSTKIFTLVVPSFLFIWVGVLCKFAVVPGVYTLLSPEEEEVHYFCWRRRCTHSTVHSSKRFKPLSDIILLSQGYCWIGKNINKEFNCLLVFIMIWDQVALWNCNLYLVSMNISEESFSC